MSRSSGNIVTDFINGTMNKGTIPDSVSPNTAAENAMSYDKQDVLSDWLYPAKKEYRQMAEQLQMDSIEPSVKMQGMIAAGINPLTAASAIAGSGSSAPQPASSVNPIGDVAGAVGAVAGAGDSVASAVSTLAKLEPEISQIESTAKANLAKAGLDEANMNAVITDNKYRGENWEAELALKRQNFKNMKQELSNMMAQHREIMTHCDEMIAQIELNGSQKEYFEAMQQKIQEDLRWQKELNDFRINNKLFITDSGVDGYTWNLLYNMAPDGDVDAFFDAFYEYCKQRNYASTIGSRNAEIDTAFDKTWNEELAKLSSNAEFAPYMAQLNSYFEVLNHTLKEMASNPHNIRGAIAKVIDIIGKAFTLVASDSGNQTIINDVSKGKPNLRPKSSR